MAEIVQARLPASWWVPLKFIEDRTTTSLQLIINQNCLKISTVHVLWKMDFELASEQPSCQRCIWFFSLLKCCPFSFPNYKPSKNCHSQMFAARFLKAQSRYMCYLCKPGVVHSISNRTFYAIAIIGHTRLCYLFVPELSTGTVHTSALCNLPR